MQEYLRFFQVVYCQAYPEFYLSQSPVLLQYLELYQKHWSGLIGAAFHEFLSQFEAL